MYRNHIVIGLVTLATLFAVLPAFAQNGNGYAASPATKLGRGVVNATTGWVEVPKQTIIGAQEAGVPGFFGGIFQGVAMGVTRTLVGGYEIGTFWAPVPEGFEPVLKPHTVFDGR